MSDTPTRDTEAIEKALVEGMQQSSAFARPQRPVIDAKAWADDRNRAAMQEVDRQNDRDALQVEAFIDSAIFTRIIAVRGAFTIGPRDIQVRHAILKWIMTINGDNSHTLDP